MLFCSDIVTTKWKKIEIEGDRPTKQTKRGVYVFPDDRRRGRGGRGNLARGRLGMLTFTFCACVSYSARFPGLSVRPNIISCYSSI